METTYKTREIRKSIRMRAAITKALGTTEWRMEHIERVSSMPSVTHYFVTILETKHLFTADLRVSFNIHRGIEVIWL